MVVIEVEESCTPPGNQETEAKEEKVKGESASS
jgi:hypothetical protein